MQKCAPFSRNIKGIVVLFSLIFFSVFANVHKTIFYYDPDNLHFTRKPDNFLYIHNLSLLYVIFMIYNCLLFLHECIYSCTAFQLQNLGNYTRNKNISPKHPTTLAPKNQFNFLSTFEVK